MIELIFLKVLTLIKLYQQVKNVICVVIGILLITILITKNILVMVVMIYLQKLLVCIIYV